MKKIILVFLIPFLSIAQTQIGNDIDGEAAGDASGFSVSLSFDGTKLAIGSPGNAENGDGSGQVRVYQNNGGTWSQVGADIYGDAAFDESGNRVSLSSDGTVVAIAAPQNSDNGFRAGRVKVYQNNAGTWMQVGTAIDGKAANDRNGSSISLSSDGTKLAIGAPWNDDNGTNAGQVRVFHNDAGVWTQVGDDINGEAAYDVSGIVSLSADGSIVAIGASDHGENWSLAGHVRVYQNIAGIWTQVGADIVGEAAGDRIGGSVSLSSDGSVVAIGADYSYIRVYKIIAGTWTKIGDDIDAVHFFNQNGLKVSLSSDGNVVAIGAPGYNGNGTSSGQTKVFQNMGGTWTQVGVEINGEAAGDFSGFGISISGDGTTLAIGAPVNEGNGIYAGHVRVFDLTGVLSSDSFVQTNFIVYPNPTANLVTIQLNEGLQLEKVNVYSALGQLVKTETNTTLSLGELAKGSYFLEVITNQGKATKTILVE